MNEGSSFSTQRPGGGLSLISAIVVAGGLAFGPEAAAEEELPASPEKDLETAGELIEEGVAGADEAGPAEGGELPGESAEPSLLPSLDDEDFLPPPSYSEDLPDAELLPELDGFSWETTEGDLEGFEEDEEVLYDESEGIFGYSGDWTGPGGGDFRNFDIFGSDWATGGAFSEPLEREGFRFGLGLLGTYDSNVRIAESNEQGEFYLTVSPSVEYRSAPPVGVPGVFIFRYLPSLRFYPGDSSLDTVDHLASAAVQYDGERGEVRAAVDFSLFSTGNQVVSGLTETRNLLFTLDGSYELTEKFGLSTELSHGLREIEQEFGPTFEDETSSVRLTGEFELTPALWAGPSLRYTHTESDALAQADSFALTLAAGYRPPNWENLYVEGELGAERVDQDPGSESTNVTGSISVDYQPGDGRFSFGGEASYRSIPPQSRRFGIGGGGGGGQELTGGLHATYTPSEPWKVQGRLQLITTASEATVGQSVESSLASLTVQRELGRGFGSVGAILRNSSYEAVGAGALPREDDTAVTGFVRYSRLILSDKATFTSSVQWTDNSGSKDWSRFQVSSGVSFSF